MIKQRKNIIAAIDIGSSKIICGMAKILGDGELEIISINSQLARGIKSGVITDLKIASDAIAQVIDEAEKISGIAIRTVYINVSSSNLISHQLNSEIDVSGHEINSNDLTKLLFNSLSKYDEQQLQVVHSFVYDYILDGNRGVTNPLGMYGSKLSCSVSTLVTPNNTIANLNNCLSKCQLDVTGYVASSYASGLACLSKEEMELGVALIEIGGGCASVSIFASGQLIFADGIAIGGRHITTDIAKGLGIGFDEAERIKSIYGSVLQDSLTEKEVIEVETDGETRLISRAILTEIITARVEEILELLDQKLINAGFSIMGNNIVLTGGVANMSGMKELVNKIFESPVRIGYPKSFAESDFEIGPSSATLVGMIINAAQHFKEATMLKSQERFSLKKVWYWFKENFI
jgi:cell division protein FtsA